MMKNPQKIKRINLPLNDHDIPVILGIVSTDQDYKLTLKLNIKLSVSLKNEHPVVVNENDGNINQFSRFLFSVPGNDTIYQLISNRTGKSFLIKKLKNIDYLLLIADAGRTVQYEKIITALREIDSVSGVFNISYESISKDKNIGFLI
ncbi:MAG: IPExxxVDY family protein [Bacteroidales bacterium]|nr:IPExxxVDY family protein [Bacteroidales bacterium]